MERRNQLNGCLPERKERIYAMNFSESYDRNLKGSGDRKLSTTMAFVRFFVRLTKK